MAEPIVMQDFKLLQRTRNQPRQRSAARKNHGQPRAFIIRQITNALSRDRLSLFGKVCSDQKIETLWGSLQTSSQDPIHQRSTSERFSWGSSSTIVAFSASSTAVRRTNQSAQ